MDPWQREHIRNKLPELLEATFCSTDLLAILHSKRVLSKNDVDEINAITTQLPKSGKLYETLRTRDNGYTTLIRALYDCMQTGALKLLVDGYFIHFIDSPNLDFQGRIGSFRDHFPQLDKNDLLSIIGNLPLDEECIELVCGNSKNPKLCHDTIPPCPKFYIERSISNRIELHPEIFQQKCSDVFVFMGIEKEILKKLVQPNLVLYSSGQLVECESRFIFLEKVWHWLEIRRISGRPIHLIQYEADEFSERKKSERYILEETIGNSEVILKFSKCPKKRAYISEDELLAKLDDEQRGNGICICDTPGMGKSWILASLARKMLQKYPKRLVGFIALSELSKQLKPEDSKPTQQIAVSLLIDVMATSHFAKSVLLRAVEKGCLSIEIFFDGLDEVPSNLCEPTTNFLKALVSEKSRLRIYVTSRPHVRRELESAIAYNLLPFTERNQTDFLVESWKQRLEIYEEKKLKEFAEMSLQSFKKEISKDERDIMGIPLQCLLLAEIHANEARLYSDPTHPLEIPLMKTTSIYDMYKRFIDKKFLCSEITLPTSSNGVELGTESEVVDTKSMKRYHLVQAYLLLFPKNQDSSPENHDHPPTSLHYSIGLLEQVHNGDNIASRFVHRTFAEYLVAEFVGDILIGERQHNPNSTDNLKFYFYHALKTVCGQDKWRINFEHAVIVSFIDKHLASAITSCEQSFVLIVQEFIDPSYLTDMLRACANFGYLHLFRFLKNILLTQPADKLKIYRPFVLCRDEYSDPNRSKSNILGCNEPSSKLLRLASVHPVQLIDECYGLLRDGFGYDSELAIRLDNPPNAHIPYKAAIRNGNFAVAEYLADRYPLQSRYLLDHCMDNSYGESEYMISGKKKILKYLLGEKKELLQELSFHYYSKNRFKSVVHLELIKCLIVEAKNILFDDKLWFEWLHKIVANVSVGMSPEDFVELIRFLVGECEKFKTENDSLESFSLVLDVARVAMRKGTSLEGGNMLLYAINRGSSLQIVQELVQFGAILQQRNCSLQGALHCAVQIGNKEMVAYFLSLGLSLEECDFYGDTPLLCAGKHLEIIKYLVENGADLRATNYEQKTIAHIAAREMTSADEFHELVVLLSQKWNATEILTKISKPNDSDDGGTPLYIRLLKKDIHMKTLVFLLERIPGLNLKDVKGSNLLYAAGMGEHSVEILKELVERGVDYSQKNRYGQNVLDLTVKKSTEAIEYFQSLGLSKST